MTTREKAYAKLEELKQFALSGAEPGETHMRLLRQAVQGYTNVLIDAINPIEKAELPYILTALRVTTSQTEKMAGKEAADIADGLIKMFRVVAVTLPQDSPLEDAARAAAEADL